MPMTFRCLSLVLSFLFILSVTPADAKRYKTDGGTFDINLHALYSLPRQNLDSAIGLGGTLYADFRVMPFLSLGANLGYSMYFGEADRHAIFAELAGRLYPLKATPSGELYLQGGVGIFMPEQNGIDEAGKRVHGTAGIGYKKWLKGNKYINLAVNLDMYSPRIRPMASLGIKAGYGMRFGRLHTPGRGRKVTAAEAALLQQKAATPVAVVVIATPVPTSTAVPATPTPVVIKKVVVPAKPAAAKPAVKAPVKAASAPAKPAVAKPAAAAAKPAAPAAVKPAAPVPTAVPAKPAGGMVEMNFGAQAKPAAKAGGSVNIDLGGAKSAAPKAAVAAPIPYKWIAGDSLTVLSEAFYGDPNLYPILVDANEAKLVLPMNLKSGVVISIPRGVDDVTKAKAREKATQPHYIQWKTAGK